MQDSLLICGSTKHFGGAFALLPDGTCRDPLLHAFGGYVNAVTERDGRLYFVVRSKTKHRGGILICTDAAGGPIKKVDFPDGSDPHGIWLEECQLCVVSSAEDAIYNFDLDLRLISKNQFGHGGDVRHHINDVTKVGDKFYATMFSPVSSPDWKEDDGRGVVMSGDWVAPADMCIEIAGLTKPHNPVIDGSDIYVCNSGAGSVTRNGKPIASWPGKWTRGLLLVDDTLYVGVADFNRATPGMVAALTKGGEVFREYPVPLSTIFAIYKRGSAT